MATSRHLLLGEHGLIDTVFKDEGNYPLNAGEGSEAAFIVNLCDYLLSDKNKEDFFNYTVEQKEPDASAYNQKNDLFFLENFIFHKIPEDQFRNEIQNITSTKDKIKKILELLKRDFHIGPLGGPDSIRFEDYYHHAYYNWLRVNAKTFNNEEELKKEYLQLLPEFVQFEKKSNPTKVPLDILANGGYTLDEFKSKKNSLPIKQDDDTPAFDDDTVTFTVVENPDSVKDLESKDEDTPGTLVAHQVTRRTSKKSAPSPSSKLTDPDLPDDDYTKLIHHYAHWSKLAEGSAGELEKVAQIKQNCQTLHSQLSKNLTSADQDKLLKKIETELENIQTGGLHKIYFFATLEKDTKTIEETLNKITKSQVTIDTRLSNYQVGSVAKDDSKSVFVQGIRNSDSSFVSEAYIAHSLNANSDQLREFVFSQIESFHADPRNLGRNIRFEGNFTPEYMALAIPYCNLRGYHWEISDELKNALLGNTSPVQHALWVSNADTSVEESTWQTWLKNNKKHPFSEFLDKKTVKQLEDLFQLERLADKDAAEAKKNTDTLISTLASDKNLQWEEFKPVATRGPIARSPIPSVNALKSGGIPTVNIAVEEKFEEKVVEQDDDEPYATLGNAPKPGDFI